MIGARARGSAAVGHGAETGHRPAGTPGGEPGALAAKSYATNTLWPPTWGLHALLTNGSADRLPARRALELEVAACPLYTTPSPRDRTRTRLPSSA